MLMDRGDSLLLVIDVQERLLPVMETPETVTDNISLLLAAAREMAVSVLVSEQYPKGLGPTVDVLRSQVEEREVLPKMAFSCAGDVAIADAIAASGRRNIVICGIEAHVCVLQSALGFLRDGYGVCVTADAVSSRRADSRETALKRMASNGVEIVTTEMVVFEWLHHAGTPEFKALSKLIK